MSVAANSATLENTGRTRWRRWLILAIITIAIGLGLALSMHSLVAMVQQRREEASATERLIPSDATKEERLVYTMSEVGGQPAIDAVHAMMKSRNAAYLPALVEMFHVAELGHQIRSESGSRYGAGNHVHHKAMTMLSGVNMKGEVNDWMEWSMQSGIEPFDGFEAWKAQLYARFDPHYAWLLDADRPATIPLSDIQFSQTTTDRMPALDEPATIAASEAEYLLDSDIVYGLKIGEDVRAYPVKIVERHEIVNDVVDDTRIVLTSCLWSGACQVYESQLSDNGPILMFGSSGLLYRSNKLMVDRVSQTLWSQFDGRPVMGSLAANNYRLNPIPVTKSTWGRWKQLHADTRVLSPRTGFRFRYSEGRNWRYLIEPVRTRFPITPRNSMFPPKVWVFGLEWSNGAATAYPVDALLKTRLINDSQTGENVVIYACDRPLFTIARRRLETSKTRRIASVPSGAEIRAYATDGRHFASSDDPMVLVDDSGDRWQVTEAALMGPGDARFERLAGQQSFWFGWYAFHPDTTVYGVEFDSASAESHSDDTDEDDSSPSTEPSGISTSQES